MPFWTQIVNSVIITCEAVRNCTEDMNFCPKNTCSRYTSYSNRRVYCEKAKHGAKSG